MDNNEEMISHIFKYSTMTINLNKEKFQSENEGYTFSDLFDLDEIQKIQDSFSLATGVASIITEVDGTPITKPSNFCRFCNEIVRKTEKGLKNCIYSDSIVGSPKEDGPRVQICLSGGLIDGGASIFVGNKHVANWLIGQIIESDSNLEQILSYADEIGAEYNAVKKALDEVTRMPKKQFEDICNFLFLTAQQMSKMAMKNIVQAQEIAKREIAEQEIKKLNKELETKVLERTYQLEEKYIELENINATLQEEIFERKKAEVQIKNLNEELENKVLDRTNALMKMNAILEEEISEKTQMHERLQKYQVLAEKANDAMLFIDREGNILEANDAAIRIYGYSDKEFSSLSIFNLRHTEKPSYIFEQMEKADREGIIFETVHYRKDGTSMKVEVSSHGTFIGDKRVIISIVRDISDRKKAEEEILYLSYHDQLTGLYNRRFYEEELKRVDTARNLPITLVMGDINGLKLANDAFGHRVGDELIKKTAQIITKECRVDDIIARIGGDEFVILLPQTDMKEAEKMIRRINQSIIQEKVDSLILSVAFGWSTKNNPIEEMNSVFKKAEDHMYRSKSSESLKMRNKTIEVIMSTLFEKNRIEQQHSQSVSDMCVALGQALDLDKESISELRTAGLMHDIGKIAISESVLNKPGALNEAEWAEVKRHSEIGYQILNSVNSFSQIAVYVQAHHERWDGKGYPKGLKSEEIPFVSRVITIADAYAAMTSERSYRKTRSDEAAVAELQKNAGSQFDPELVKIFIEKVVGQKV